LERPNAKVDPGIALTRRQAQKVGKKAVGEAALEHIDGGFEDSGGSYRGAR
jgi:hypothetical protein